MVYAVFYQSDLSSLRAVFVRIVNKNLRPCNRVILGNSYNYPVRTGGKPAVGNVKLQNNRSVGRNKAAVNCSKLYAAVFLKKIFNNSTCYVSSVTYRRFYNSRRDYSFKSSLSILGNVVALRKVFQINQVNASVAVKVGNAAVCSAVYSVGKLLHVPVVDNTVIVSVAYKESSRVSAPAVVKTAGKAGHKRRLLIHVYYLLVIGKTVC